MTIIKHILFKCITSLLLCIVIIGLIGCSLIQNTSNTKNINTNIAILISSYQSDTQTALEYIQMIKLGISDGAKNPIKTTTYYYHNQDQFSESLNNIYKQNTDIIIAVTSPEDMVVIAQKNKQYKTDIVVLSSLNIAELANAHTFICGHNTMMSFDQIIDYFTSHSYHYYITLLPKQIPELEDSIALNDMINNKGGNIIASKSYSSYKDIENIAQSLSQLIDQFNENEFKQKKPIIIIDDKQQNLEALYAILKKFNIDKKAIIAGNANINISIPFDIDLYFAGSKLIQDNNLLIRALESGINHISYQHSIAYDMGKIAARCSGYKYNRLSFIKKMRFESFLGISGEITFKDSIAIRKYDITRN